MEYPPDHTVMDGYRGSRSTIPAEVKATILDMHDQGISGREIGRRVGVSVASVSRIVHAAGLSFDQDQTHAATVARVRQMRAKRVELTEQLHITAVMAIALAQEQMISEPTNHRSRAESMKAVRDSAAALADLIKVDQPQGNAELGLESAFSFIDGMTAGIEAHSGAMTPGDVLVFRPLAEGAGTGGPPESEMIGPSPMDIYSPPSAGELPTQDHQGEGARDQSPQDQEGSPQDQ